MKHEAMERLRFTSGLTPQRRFMLQEFSRAVQGRKLRTSDLMLAMIHLREMKMHPEFLEWGSSVAHIRRNQGSIWTQGVSIWATHVFYANLDENDVPISPLPLSIFRSIEMFLEEVSEFQLAQDFADLFSGGSVKDEIFALLDHLYYVPEPKNSKEPKEMGAFAVLNSSHGIAEEDKFFMQRLILYVREIALELLPASLGEIVAILEKTLLQINGKDAGFTEDDKKYLELHMLVAFHNTLFDFSPKAFKVLTGSELRELQPMLFVSSMSKVLTLDMGFFELEEGKYLEPISLQTASRFEKYYYPVLSSSLSEEDYLVEADSNIRTGLYNHPLLVRKYRDRWVIMAENRTAGRFPPESSRYLKRRRSFINLADPSFWRD